MKKTTLKNYFLIILAMGLISSCTNLKRNMKEGNTLVQFQKADFTLTDQTAGEAKQVKILGVDWKRLFKKEKGNLVLTPLVGSNTSIDKVKSYALYDLLSKNSGYDVVFYPSFDQTRFKILFFYSKTEVTVKARLGKLNK